MSASTGGKCDSFKFHEREMEEPFDFIYEEKADLKCTVSSFDDGFFETDWKSCTAEEYSRYLLGGDSVEENIQDIVDRLNESENN